MLGCRGRLCGPVDDVEDSELVAAQAERKRLVCSNEVRTHQPVVAEGIPGVPLPRPWSGPRAPKSQDRLDGLSQCSGVAGAWHVRARIRSTSGRVAGRSPVPLHGSIRGAESTLLLD